MGGYTLTNSEAVLLALPPMKHPPMLASFKGVAQYTEAMMPGTNVIHCIPTVSAILHHMITFQSRFVLERSMVEVTLA